MATVVRSIYFSLSIEKFALVSTQHKQTPPSVSLEPPSPSPHRRKPLELRERPRHSGSAVSREANRAAKVEEKCRKKDERSTRMDGFSSRLSISMERPVRCVIVWWVTSLRKGTPTQVLLFVLSTLTHPRLPSTKLPLF